MYLFLDIGGTNTKIGISRNLKNLDSFYKVNTPYEYKDFLVLIKGFLNNKKFKKVIIGFAGMVENGKILKAPNLPSFDNKNLKRDLEKIFSSEVIVKNDAEFAGLGEATFGAGKNYKILGYITWSTGIGGAKIVNKKIEDNFFGFEPGHSLFLISPYNIFSNKIYFEEIEKILGGRSIEKFFDRKPEEIKDKKFWKTLTKIFAGFLVNVSLFWSCEVIIVGGSFIKSIDFDDLKINFENLKTMPVKTRILKSRLGDKSGLLGALFYAKNFL